MKLININAMNETKTFLHKVNPLIVTDEGTESQSYKSLGFYSCVYGVHGRFSLATLFDCDSEHPKHPFYCAVYLMFGILVYTFYCKWWEIVLRDTNSFDHNFRLESERPSVWTLNSSRINEANTISLTKIMKLKSFESYAREKHVLKIPRIPFVIGN